VVEEEQKDEGAQRRSYLPAESYDDMDWEPLRDNRKRNRQQLSPNRHGLSPSRRARPDPPPAQGQA
jgi:hypothetical protein